jgi:hypothetical protein
VFYDAEVGHRMLCISKHADYQHRGRGETFGTDSGPKLEVWDLDRSPGGLRLRLGGRRLSAQPSEQSQIKASLMSLPGSSEDTWETVDSRYIRSGGTGPNV